MDRLFKLLNAGAKSLLTPENTLVGEPSPIDRGWQNTQVLLSGRFSAGTYFTRTFYYRRLILGNHPTLEMEYSNQAKFSDFLPEINAWIKETSILGVGTQTRIYPLELRSNDIVDLGFVPAPAGMTRAFTISASPTSYVFTGSLRLRVTTPAP